MPTETITKPAEKLKEAQYTYKSFELVFLNFCVQYDKNLCTLIPQSSKNGNPENFLGLPPDASVQQMGHRLNKAAEVMGDPPRWEDDQAEGVTMKEAVLLSARYLAWHATMGGITQQYIDKLNELIQSERNKNPHNGGNHQNLKKLSYDRNSGLAILLAQNHALRDYFDSGLAATLGNDSPERMSQLLRHASYGSERRWEDLVAGISLEIASKNYLETLMKNRGLDGTSIAYGSDEQDSRAGDLVVQAGGEIMFIDVKSSMPKRFSDGESSTPADYEKGYKWLASADQEHKVVVWAYQSKPIAPEKFKLIDTRFASNLELVVGAINS